VQQLTREGFNTRLVLNSSGHIAAVLEPLVTPIFEDKDHQDWDEERGGRGQGQDAHQRLKMRTTRTGTMKEGGEGPPPPPDMPSTCLDNSRRYSNANTTPAPRLRSTQQDGSADVSGQPWAFLEVVRELCLQVRSGGREH
jgi:hypothetical protein